MKDSENVASNSQRSRASPTYKKMPARHPSASVAAKVINMLSSKY